MPKPHEILKIAAESYTAPKTVRATYRDPSAVRSSTLAKIAEAASRLGIEPPSLEKKAA